ncbi:MAG: hypothetical protein EBX40_05280 [Gammaproteobacteria bacterium]|nr:hypothetical protein [Gammaproteobacteria bacterium]
MTTPPGGAPVTRTPNPAAAIPSAPPLPQVAVSPTAPAVPAPTAPAAAQSSAPAATPSSSSSQGSPALRSRIPAEHLKGPRQFVEYFFDTENEWLLDSKGIHARTGEHIFGFSKQFVPNPDKEPMFFLAVKNERFSVYGGNVFTQPEVAKMAMEKLIQLAKDHYPHEKPTPVLDFSMRLFAGDEAKWNKDHIKVVSEQLKEILKDPTNHQYVSSKDWDRFKKLDSTFPDNPHLKATQAQSNSAAANPSNAPTPSVTVMPQTPPQVPPAGAPTASRAAGVFADTNNPELASKKPRVEGPSGPGH